MLFLVTKLTVRFDNNGEFVHGSPPLAYSLEQGRHQLPALLEFQDSTAHLETLTKTIPSFGPSPKNPLPRSGLRP